MAKVEFGREHANSGHRATPSFNLAFPWHAGLCHGRPKNSLASRGNGMERVNEIKLSTNGTDLVQSTESPIKSENFDYPVNTESGQEEAGQAGTIVGTQAVSIDTKKQVLIEPIRPEGYYDCDDIQIKMELDAFIEEETIRVEFGFLETERLGTKPAFSGRVSLEEPSINRVPLDSTPEVIPHAEAETIYHFPLRDSSSSQHGGHKQQNDSHISCGNKVESVPSEIEEIGYGQLADTALCEPYGYELAASPAATAVPDNCEDPPWLPEESDDAVNRISESDLLEPFLLDSERPAKGTELTWFSDDANDSHSSTKQISEDFDELGTSVFSSELPPEPETQPLGDAQQDELVYWNLDLTADHREAPPVTGNCPTAELVSNKESVLTAQRKNYITETTQLVTALVRTMTLGQKVRFYAWFNSGLSIEEAAVKSKIRDLIPPPVRHPNCKLSKKRLGRLSLILPTVYMQRQFVHETYFAGAEPKQAMKYLLKALDSENLMETFEQQFALEERATKAKQLRREAVEQPSEILSAHNQPPQPTYEVPIEELNCEVKPPSSRRKLNGSELKAYYFWRKNGLSVGEAKSRAKVLELNPKIRQHPKCEHSWEKLLQAANALPNKQSREKFIVEVYFEGKDPRQVLEDMLPGANAYLPSESEVAANEDVNGVDGNAGEVLIAESSGGLVSRVEADGTSVAVEIPGSALDAEIPMEKFSVRSEGTHQRPSEPPVSRQNYSSAENGSKRSQKKVGNERSIHSIGSETLDAFRDEGSSYEEASYDEECEISEMSLNQLKKYYKWRNQGLSHVEALTNARIINLVPTPAPHPGCQRPLTEVKAMSNAIPDKHDRLRFQIEVYYGGKSPEKVMNNLSSYRKIVPSKARFNGYHDPKRGVAPRVTPPSDENYVISRLGLNHLKKYYKWRNQGFSHGEALGKARTPGLMPQSVPHPDCQLSWEEVKSMSYTIVGRRRRTWFQVEVFYGGKTPKDVMKLLPSSAMGPLGSELHQVCPVSATNQRCPNFIHAADSFRPAEGSTVASDSLHSTEVPSTSASIPAASTAASCLPTVFPGYIADFNYCDLLQPLQTNPWYVYGYNFNANSMLCAPYQLLAVPSMAYPMVMCPVVEQQHTYPSPSAVPPEPMEEQQPETLCTPSPVFAAPTITASSISSAPTKRTHHNLYVPCKAGNNPTSSDNHSQCFIVPSNFPEQSLTGPQMDTIESDILEAVLEMYDSNIKPYFKQSFRSEGRYGIICCDQFSVGWLHKYLLNYQPWEGACLRLITTNTTMITANAVLPLCEEDDKQILSFIEEENYKLNVGKWTVVHRWDNSNGNTLMDLIIDEESAEILRKCSRISFKLGSAEIITAKNDSPFDNCSEKHFAPPLPSSPPPPSPPPPPPCPPSASPPPSPKEPPVIDTSLGALLKRATKSGDKELPKIFEMSVERGHSLSPENIGRKSRSRNDRPRERKRSRSSSGDLRLPNQRNSSPDRIHKRKRSTKDSEGSDSRSKSRDRTRKKKCRRHSEKRARRASKSRTSSRKNSPRDCFYPADERRSPSKLSSPCSACPYSFISSSEDVAVIDNMEYAEYLHNSASPNPIPVIDLTDST